MRSAYLRSPLPFHIANGGQWLSADIYSTTISCAGGNGGKGEEVRKLRKGERVVAETAGVTRGFGISEPLTWSRRWPNATENMQTGWSTWFPFSMPLLLRSECARKENRQTLGTAAAFRGHGFVLISASHSYTEGRESTLSVAKILRYPLAAHYSVGTEYLLRWTPPRSHEKDPSPTLSH